MEIDRFDEGSFFYDDFWDRSADIGGGGEIEPDPFTGGGDVALPGPEIFADAVDEPFADEIAPSESPAVDLGLPQIGVPVFELDPVVGTNPVSDILNDSPTE